MKEWIRSAFPQSKYFDLCVGNLIAVPDDSGTAFFQICHQFACSGWSCQIQREEGDVSFASFRNQTQMAQVSWSPREKMVQVVTEAYRDLPDTEVPVSCVTTPLVTQMRLSYLSYDCGMVYLIRLPDGRFVVIDGGMGECEEPEHFLELMEHQNVLDSKPVIAAWFVTHAHCDHYLLLFRLIERYADRFQVQRLLYNFPREDRSSGFSILNPDFQREVDAHCPVETITPRTGQRYYLGGGVFDVLYTADDVCSEFVPNLNETSLVMRMELGNYRVLWLADAQMHASKILCCRYAPVSLQCEVVQVGHHGYWGGSPELYRLANPEILLWPVPDCRYYEMCNETCNNFLVQSRKIKGIFVSGRKDAILDMTETPEQWLKQLETPEVPAGSAIYQADFSSGNLLQLGWSFLVGGGIAYTPGEITLDNGICRVRKAGETFACCEICQPDRMEAYPSFSLFLQGQTGTDCEMVGLFFNNPTPTKWNPEQLEPLQLKPNETFHLELRADYRAGVAALYRDGSLVWEKPYFTAGRRGIYLVLKNADILLQNVRIVNRNN